MFAVFVATNLFDFILTFFPRASKKPRSDEELCYDIKALLSSVGLPENYVPTMKELVLYGRF